MLQALSRRDHAGLRIDPARALEVASGVHLVPLALGEIRRVAAQFPVFLAKDAETGAFYPAALLGLAPGENLFWEDRRFDSDVVPLNLLRQPFVVLDHGEDAQAIGFDDTSPGIVAEGGQPIVAADGSDSDYFRSIQAILGELAGAQSATREFVAALVEARLVTELTIDVAFVDGSRASLQGLYTIDERAFERKLHEIAPAAHALIIAAMAISADQVRALVRRKNRRLAEDAAWLASPDA